VSDRSWDPLLRYEESEVFDCWGLQQGQALEDLYFAQD